MVKKMANMFNSFTHLKKKEIKVEETKTEEEKKEETKVEEENKK